MERRLSAPGAGCNPDAAEERLVWANGAGVRGSSPVKEQHLPPGVEMGRNGPEHRPGSETPRPLLRSGRRAGRKSVTLTPPLPPAFLAGAPSPQPLLLREAEGGPNVPAATPPSRLSGAWPEGKFEGVKEVGLEEESEGVQEAVSKWT